MGRSKSTPCDGKACWAARDPRAMVQRWVHLGAILTLAAILLAPFRGTQKSRPSAWLVLDLLGSKPHVPVAYT